MATFVLVANLCVTLAYALLYVSLPFTAFSRKDLSRRWLWAIGIFLCPLLFFFMIQKGRLESPSILGWALRFVLAGAAFFALGKIGDSTFVNSPTMLHLKGNAAMLFSSEIEFVHGGAIYATGKRTFEDQRFCSSAFAIAGTAVILGALQFYAPVVKSAFLAIFFFCVSLTLHIALTGWYIDAVSKSVSDDLVSVLYTSRSLQGFYAVLLMLIAAVAMWTWSDIRHYQKPADAGSVDE